MTASSTCCRYVVRGKVQGVFFRASAVERARALALTGWVRNLPDGSVEAVARGSAAALDAFAGWLAEGPARARVTAVSSEAVELETPATFEAR